MKNKVILLILFTVTILFAGCQTEQVRLEKAMHKSITWLWAQQGADGGWHSKTHAVLKDGKALSPYILYHLLLVPDEKYQKSSEAIENGLVFIRREIKSSMTMSEDSLPMLNYPNYSAAYALKVLCLLQKDTALQQIIVDHLLREQFAEHRGITPDNLAYGGWGYGEPNLPFGSHGHVDLSHTRRIVEALVGTKNTHKSQDTHLLRSYALTLLRSTQLFLQGAQRSPDDPRLYEGCTNRKNLPYDGGFISSAVTLATNKSEPVFIPEAGYHYPSYATATCDGLMALHALGLEKTQTYKDAVQWLQDHQNMDTIDGLSENDTEQWHQVMHYYHFAVRAEAMVTAGITGSWWHEITKILLKEQQPDGYYINPIGGVNKEDDPLMATILAVQAGCR